MYVRQSTSIPKDASAAASTSTPIQEISLAPITPNPRFFPSTTSMHHPPARAQVAINGLTPACIAALHGRSDHLRSLHNTGIDLNTTTYEDWSPALLAALNGHTNSLRFLASIGVNLHIATRLGTPLSIARESGHFQAANFILYTLLQDPQWLARTQAIIFNNSLRELVENDEVLFMANTDNSSSKPN